LVPKKNKKDFHCNHLRSFVGQHTINGRGINEFVWRASLNKRLQMAIERRNIFSMRQLSSLSINNF
jgi:hypothetical protein